MDLGGARARTRGDGRRRPLRRLEDGIEALLQRAEALNCKVVIITNADEDWVRFSSQQFLPRIVPLLQNLRVVSARRYEHLYPGRSVCWKAAAFTHVAKAFFHGEDPSGARPREIVSIGDSNDERLAVRAAAAPPGRHGKGHKAGRRAVARHGCVPARGRRPLSFPRGGARRPSTSTWRRCWPTWARRTATTGPRRTPSRVWNDAAWGLLTAIRFQDANPAPVTDWDAGLARLAIDNRPSRRTVQRFAWYLTLVMFASPRSAASATSEAERKTRTSLFGGQSERCVFKSHPPRPVLIFVANVFTCMCNTDS